MNVAYVDTSCLVAVLFGESGARVIDRRLSGMDELLSSNLLEAELRAAILREGLAASAMPDLGISWISPDRLLSGEILRVLAAGRVRGADCWHLACALYAFPEPSEITFLTLDDRQRAVARALGFVV
jgi:predicted nucleic acid-binding protein